MGHSKKSSNSTTIGFIIGLIICGVVILGFAFFSEFEVLDAEVYQAKFIEDEDAGEYDVELLNRDQYEKFFPDYRFDIDYVTNEDMTSQEAWVVYGEYNQYLFGMKISSKAEGYIDTYESKQEALDRKEYLLKNVVSDLSPNFPADSD